MSFVNPFSLGIQSIVSDADSFTLQDATDKTKKAKFDVSGVSAGTTKTVNLSGLVDLTSTQTLTNKTLTSPTISDGVIVVPGSSGNIDLTLPSSSNDKLVALGTTDTLTNKTLVTPKIDKIGVSGGVLTLPTSTDTLVGRVTTDTLTNKTLTSPTITSPTISSPTITGTTNATQLYMGDYSSGTTPIHACRNSSRGSNANTSNGPGCDYYIDTQAQPICQLLPYDNVTTHLSMGAYYDSAGWKQSNTTGAYSFTKNAWAGKFQRALSSTGTNLTSASPGALGNTVTWEDTMTFALDTGLISVIQGFNVTNGLTADSLKLATTGGTPSALNYYEEYTWSTTLTNAFSTPVSAKFYIVRNGSLVNISWGGVLAIANGAVYQFDTTDALPTRFLPNHAAGLMKYAFIALNGAAGVPGYFTINPNTYIVSFFVLDGTKLTGESGLVPGSIEYNTL